MKAYIMPSRNNQIITTERLRRFLFREPTQKLRRLARIANSYDEYKYRQSFRFLPSVTAGNLEQNGYSRYEMPDGITASLLEYAMARFKSLHPDEMIVQEHKEFYRDCLNKDDYEPSTPFMQYALDEGTLEVIGRYLGCVPYLQSIELINSRPSTKPLNKTHFFHRDIVDRRIVKVFTYITDVDETCGPLTVMPLPVMNSAPWTVRHMLGFFTDEVLKDRIDLNKAVTFTGKAGSVMMADTKRLLHMGSRCRNPRLTFVAHYNSGFGYYPRYGRHQWNPNDYRLRKLQRMALCKERKIR